MRAPSTHRALRAPALERGIGQRAQIVHQLRRDRRDEPPPGPRPRGDLRGDGLLFEVRGAFEVEKEPPRIVRAIRARFAREGIGGILGEWGG
jgi:hypothetical protein